MHREPLASLGSVVSGSALAGSFSCQLVPLVLLMLPLPGALDVALGTDQEGENMKQFEMMQPHDAIKYASEGGQALHLHTINAGHPLFRRYPEIAHLFDMDAERLTATVKRLGVRVVKIERPGTNRQHIDLCGRPLEKAKITAL